MCEVFKIMTLYELRKSKKLTVRKVAEAMGISASYYSHLEVGRRKFSENLIAKCANALDESIELITDKVNQISDTSLLSRSWISNIRVNGVNILKAFEEDMKYESIDRTDELVNRFASFARANIAQEITREFYNSEELLNLFAERFNVK